MSMTKKLNRQAVVVSSKTSPIARSKGVRVVGLSIVVLLILMVATVAARHWMATPARVAKSTLSTAPQARANVPARKRFVERGRIHFQLQKTLREMGDRLEKPGNERLILTGIITRPGQKEANPIQVVSELSGSVRVQEQTGQLSRVTLWDGTEVKHSQGALGTPDTTLLETLSYDSAEHYFLGQTQGLGMREIGFRFREDDGSATDYAGPYYDVYRVNDQIQFGSTSRKQIKFYYLNSDTFLLERVRYEDDRNGTPTKVEVQLGNWHKVQGQMVPGSITRLENGETVFRVEFGQTAIVATAADGTFSRF